jgi:ferredoxin
MEDDESSHFSIDLFLFYNTLILYHVGACGGELACSTCHLIFEPELYDALPEKEEEEDDMLDLAFEVTET